MALLSSIKVSEMGRGVEDERGMVYVCVCVCVSGIEIERER